MVDGAITHLPSLPAEGKAMAAEYVWRAPSPVNMPLRRTLQGEPWLMQKKHRGPPEWGRPLQPELAREFHSRLHPNSSSFWEIRLSLMVRTLINSGGNSQWPVIFGAATWVV